MKELELNIKIQVSKKTDEELVEAFALALDTYAAAIRAGGIPTQLPIRGTDVNAMLEVQATTSYINSIERKSMSDIARLKVKINSEATPESQKPMLRSLLSDMEEMLHAMQTGEQGEAVIRMYDLGPKGFDPSYP